MGNTKLFLGIDPSQRHTGLCALQGELPPVFYEIKPQHEDLLNCGLEVREKLLTWVEGFGDLAHTDLIIGMEKQGNAGRSSSLLFYIQMKIFEVVEVMHYQGRAKSVSFINPLPIQLASYMKRQHGVDIKTKLSIVESFKNQYGKELKIGRISQHCVEAFYLAHLAKDVISATWKYTAPSWDLKLFPWSVIYEK